MRIFLGVLSRGRVPAQSLTARIETTARATLPFGAQAHQSSVWVAPSGRLALWAWDNQASADHTLLDTGVDGRLARAWGGHDYMVTTGDASAITADDVTGSLMASTSLGRLAPVYWTRTADAWLVCGRALLLARLASSDGLPRYDRAGLVPFVTDGYLRHDGTPYSDVHLLGPAGSLTVRGDDLTVEVPDPADLRCGELVPQASDLDELARELVSAVTLSAAGDVVCTLTGGRDSRLVAAALHAAGIPFGARTRGASDHPDVLVAARVAQVLGVPHERVPLPTTSDGDGDVLEVDLAARTRSTLFASDGMLFAWENVIGASVAGSEGGTTFGGNGGETLRGGFAKRVSKDLEPSWEAASAFLWSRQSQFGRLFRPGVADDYARTLQAWIDADRLAGVPAGVSLDRYYVWYRTGRWKAAFLAAGNVRDVRHPLLDDPITRIGLRLAPAAKSMDRITRGLTIRLAPGLRDVPYGDQAHAHDEVGGPAEVDDVTSAPGPALPFDWRRTTTDQMFQAFRDQVFEGRGSEALFAIMHRDRLAHWFDRRAQQPAPTFARIPMFMWGLYSCSVLLSNDWLDPERGASQLVRVRVPAGQAVDDSD